jgi:uncharacterized protein YkwD
MSVSGSFDLAEMLRLINEERTSRGLHPLLRDRTLDNVAYIQTAWIIWDHGSQLTHEGRDGRFVEDRLREKGVPFRWYGENLVVGGGKYGPVERAHQALMNSSGHRENILREGFNRIGLAKRLDRAHSYQSVICCQVFTD